MIQFREKTGTEGRKDGWKDEQTLFHGSFQAFWSKSKAG